MENNYYLKILETGEYYCSPFWGSTVLSRNIEDAKIFKSLDFKDDLDDWEIEELLEKGTVQIITILGKKI